jgi:hypothetical protein
MGGGGSVWAGNAAEAGIVAKRTNRITDKHWISLLFLIISDTPYLVEG